jgi:hypothetical protein
VKLSSEEKSAVAHMEAIIRTLEERIELAERDDEVGPMVPRREAAIGFWGAFLCGLILGMALILGFSK